MTVVDNHLYNVYVKLITVADNQADIMYTFSLVLKRTVSLRRFFWAPKNMCSKIGINI